MSCKKALFQSLLSNKNHKETEQTHTASNPSFRFSLNFVTKESMSLFLATSYKVKRDSNYKNWKDYL